MNEPVPCYIMWPTEAMREEYESGIYAQGATEPPTVDLLATIMRTTCSRRVLELGGFLGTTSAWLALTLQAMDGGTLDIVELDPGRAVSIRERLHDLPIPDVSWVVHTEDSIKFLTQERPPSWQLAFVDDDHAFGHVSTEMRLLVPQMYPHGIIALHDVVGEFGLDEIVHQHGGAIIRTPQLHRAGGLGLVTL